MHTNVRVDFSARIGRVKAMHAVGQPPFPHMSGDYMHYLSEAHIPYSRLHDVGGLSGGDMHVDIPNVFRDCSADETDPASYDSGFTDERMKVLHKNGVRPQGAEKQKKRRPPKTPTLRAILSFRRRAQSPVVIFLFRERRRRAAQASARPSACRL